MIDKLRKLENTHILLWLLKDTAWILDFKTFGTIMILPTIAMAFFIAWISRTDFKEFIHNLAVCCWILANSIWMIGEFFMDDTTRPFAAALFILGLALVIYYYITFYIKQKKRIKAS